MDDTGGDDKAIARPDLEFAAADRKPEAAGTAEGVLHMGMVVQRPFRPFMGKTEGNDHVRRVMRQHLSGDARTGRHFRKRAHLNTDGSQSDKAGM